jgi:hypothetical protein
MSDINPYDAQAGPELDRLVHEKVMGQTSEDPAAYSTDERAARRVLAKLKADFGRTVVTGRTSLRDKRWFARYETNASDGTEVLAETLELAICRLALLRVIKEP